MLRRAQSFHRSKPRRRTTAPDPSATGNSAGRFEMNDSRSAPRRAEDRIRGPHIPASHKNAVPRGKSVRPRFGHECGWPITADAFPSRDRPIAIFLAGGFPVCVHEDHRRLLSHRRDGGLHRRKWILENRLHKRPHLDVDTPTFPFCGLEHDRAWPGAPGG